MNTRRDFIKSAICLIAAPAIVRASSLMPVKSFSEWPGVQSWYYMTDTDAWFMSTDPSDQVMALVQNMRETRAVIAGNLFMLPGS